MAREARVVLETVPYHITQRGNNRQDVFLLDDDRRFYIQALRAKARQHGLTILGWRLMTNHVHLVAIPQRPDSLAKAVGQAHWPHTMRFNRRHGRGGHLCHGRFYSCPLGPAQLVTALAYVDLNPVRAGLAGRAEQYPCAVAHGRNAPADPLVDGRAWSVLALAQDWAQRLEVEAAGVRNAALRQATFFRAALWRREVHRGDEVDLGNGVTEITAFNSRLQPCAITAGSLLSLSFAYGTGQPSCGDYGDNNGHVREQKITGPGATPFSQTYDYDKVNRLLSVTEDLTNWSRVYSYDGFGNRALTGVGQGAAVGIQQPQALTDFEASNNRLKTAWADYDNASNLTHSNILATPPSTGRRLTTLETSNAGSARIPQLRAIHRTAMSTPNTATTERAGECRRSSIPPGRTRPRLPTFTTPSESSLRSTRLKPRQAQAARSSGRRTTWARRVWSPTRRAHARSGRTFTPSASGS
jgi:putative transposase